LELSVSYNSMQQATNPSATFDEEALILAAKRQPERFKPLYEKYYPSILKFVFRRVVTKDDAYDITQQVFLQAMLSLHKYEYRGLPFSSWLYRIAINELNQVFRKGSKMRGVNFDTEELGEMVEEMLGAADIQEKEDVLMQTLLTLDESEYQLVEMRFFEKRQFKEIADILSITEANAKMKLYRILDKLKPVIEKQLSA
jgi:RNA polymerase sigma-70 factor (ECF subfamily)